MWDAALGFDVEMEGHKAPCGLQSWNNKGCAGRQRRSVTRGPLVAAPGQKSLLPCMAEELTKGALDQQCCHRAL